MFAFHLGRGCGPRGYVAMWSHRRGGGRGMGWGDGFGDGGSGSRRGRVFDAGELRLVLLRLLEDMPRHGYDLIRAIEERTGGAYAPSPGVIYPTLTLLEDMGLIAEERTDGTKKLYAITDAGRAHLAENKDASEALLRRLDDLGETRRRSDGSSIRRAMGNLGAVLANTFARGELDDAKLHDIVALIDEAAAKIERL